MTTNRKSNNLIATIGYEGSELEDVIATLQESGIELLVDIRERAQSRKKGFSKNALSNAAEENGIRYLHLRSLGDPKPGREAARSGQWDLFLKIYAGVMASKEAKIALVEIEYWAKTKSICLLCYEKDFEDCHRNIVATHLAKRLDKVPVHLKVADRDDCRKKQGRMLHSRQGATASVQ